MQETDRRNIMNIDPEEFIEGESARILKPLDELLEKEADALKKEEERIAREEQKCDKIFPPAKRMDEK
jgi:hypothetical protein